MKERIKYITDSKGKRTSVIVPFEEWEEIMKKNNTLTSQLRILRGIKEGLKEVSQSRKTGKELQTLSDFLDECKN